ncbi:MAG: hypothetical protein ACREIV_10040, partial [Planctomycetaceae bacterium]
MGLFRLTRSDRTSARRRPVAALAVALMVALCGGESPAQPPADPASSEVDSPETEAPAPPAGESPAQDDADLDDADLIDDAELIYLPGPNGTLVPVFDRATLAEFRRWQVQQRQTGDAPRERPFEITRIDLQGEADDEQAALTATIVVAVKLDATWVAVPLGLNEAVLTGKRYDGAGQERLELGEQRNGGGSVWWFRGRGEHTLTLSLLVPLRKQLPLRQLQLTLPAAPVSSIALDVPIPHGQLSVLPIEQAVVRTRPAAAGRSRIEVFGLPPRLTLQWKPVPNQRRIETSLQVETEIAVKPNEESVVLTATQTVQALHGSFTEIEVELPGAFELIGVEGEAIAGHH